MVEEKTSSSTTLLMVKLLYRFLRQVRAKLSCQGLFDNCENYVVNLEKDILKYINEHNAFLKELGLDLLP